MKFTEDFINKVRESTDLVEIISQYTQLKPAGGGMMGLCPFPDHTEKTPSFSVSPGKQMYNCFGCHKSGNVFHFLQTFNGMSFPESVEYLAHRANLTLPEYSKDQHEKADATTQKKRQLLLVTKYATQYFVENFKRLAADHPAKIYAYSRGLDNETIQNFQIGYASEDWDGLIRYLEGKGIPLPLAEEARLINARTDGKTGYYDSFRQRLMFSIFSNTGEVIAFSGRIIGEGQPKYKNSGDSLIFTKGRVLFGGYQAAKYIHSADQALLVEGNLDMISLYQGGFQNVVAPLGTAFTFDQAKIISRMTKNIVVVFDGDQAGQDAMERSLPILLQTGMLAKGVQLPHKEDPDSYLKKNGKEAFAALISSAKDLFSLVLDKWLEGYKAEPSQKIRITDMLIPLMSQIQDQRLKSLYLQEAAFKMAVEPKWLHQALTAANTNQSSNSSYGNSSHSYYAKSGPTKEENKISFSSGNELILEEIIDLKDAPKLEKTLLSYVLKNHANFLFFLQQDIMSFLSHKGIREVLHKATVLAGQNPNDFDKLTSLLATYVKDSSVFFEYQKTETNSVVDSSVSDARDLKLLGDCFKKIRETKFKEQTKQLSQEIKTVTDSSQEKMEQILKLNRDRLNLSK